MESQRPSKTDDGVIRINRLTPGHVDIVLGSHPGKALPRPIRPQRPYAMILLCGLLALLSLCLLLSQLRRHAADIAPPPKTQAPESSAAKPSEPSPAR